MATEDHRKSVNSLQYYPISFYLEMLKSSLGLDVMPITLFLIFLLPYLNLRCHLPWSAASG